MRSKLQIGRELLSPSYEHILLKNFKLENKEIWIFLKSKMQSVSQADRAGILEPFDFAQVTLTDRDMG